MKYKNIIEISVPELGHNKEIFVQTSRMQAVLGEIGTFYFLP